MALRSFDDLATDRDGYLSCFLPDYIFHVADQSAAKVNDVNPTPVDFLCLP